MLILDKTFQFAPLIDISSTSFDADKASDCIYEYILSKARKTILNNSPVKVLHLSGLANYHHNELIQYLKSNSDLTQPQNFVLQIGEFGDTNIKHCWIQIDDIIIDLTLKQFENCPRCAPSFLCNFFNVPCYISNNRQSLIYQLYKPYNE